MTRPGISRIVITALRHLVALSLSVGHLFEELRGCRRLWSTPRNFATATRLLMKETLVIALSQSGETADTLAAIAGSQAARGAQHRTVNVVGSTIPAKSTVGFTSAAVPKSACQHQGVHIAVVALANGGTPRRALKD